ncbi:MAG: tRNA pseudouridine(55) synthase TruB [Deltaproteobacteria bacterium]|nr:tRNA pseudouridine(55) synthase TruB [Deltaproteobacteria bacterium]
MGVSGILVIDKPVGPTSHDVVAQVRRLLREKKVGHTGTLDPLATGVLPLVIGRATKVARYLTGGDKVYRATFRLGVSTTTFDADGEVTAQRPVNVTRDQVDAALGEFVGDITQIPPMYSAKKVQGKRLYELARQGVEVEREPKHVKVHWIKLLALQGPDLTVEVRCSAGTYMRALAHDVGEALGCGGHLKELRRLAAGAFTLDDAVMLDALERDPALAVQKVLPIARGLSEVPRIKVPMHVARMVVAGHQLSVADLRTLDTPTFVTYDVVTLWLDSGELLAVARALLASEELNRSRRDRRALKTERVIAELARS